MSLNKFLISLGIIILTLGLVISALLIKKKWAYSGVVVDDICLKQEFMKSEYRLVTCLSDQLIVGDVRGWIIEERIIYGTFSFDKYFVFEFKNKITSNFASMHEINSYLKENGVQFYDMNKEENVYHLRYGNGRNRKY